MGIFENRNKCGNFIRWDSALWNDLWGVNTRFGRCELRQVRHCFHGNYSYAVHNKKYSRIRVSSKNFHSPLAQYLYTRKKCAYMTQQQQDFSKQMREIILIYWGTALDFVFCIAIIIYYYLFYNLNIHVIKICILIILRKSLDVAEQSNHIRSISLSAVKKIYQMLKRNL